MGTSIIKLNEVVSDELPPLRQRPGTAGLPGMRRRNPAGRPVAANAAGPQVDLPPDLTDRVLCPDGACIGILDDQKKCSVCGFAYQEEIAAEQSAQLQPANN